MYCTWSWSFAELLIIDCCIHWTAFMDSVERLSYFFCWSFCKISLISYSRSKTKLATCQLWAYIMPSILYGVGRIITSRGSIHRVVHEMLRSHLMVCLSLSVKLLVLPVMSLELQSVLEMYVFCAYFWQNVWNLMTMVTFSQTALFIEFPVWHISGMWSVIACVVVHSDFLRLLVCWISELCIAAELSK